MVDPTAGPAFTHLGQDAKKLASQPRKDLHLPLRSTFEEPVLKYIYD